MRVFITGATGYVGKAVALAFARAGHSVRALARSEAAAERLSALALVPVVGDMRSPNTLCAAAGNDVIVHAAIESGPDRLRIDRAAIEALLEVAKAFRALAGRSRTAPVIRWGGVSLPQLCPSLATIPSS